MLSGANGGSNTENLITYTDIILDFAACDQVEVDSTTEPATTGTLTTSAGCTTCESVTRGVWDEMFVCADSLA